MSDSKKSPRARQISSPGVYGEAPEHASTSSAIVTADTIDRVQRTGVAPLSTEMPAQIAGRFSIVRRLGTGGMGTVFLAYDEQLAREVAIKTLRTDHLGGSDRGRWLATFRAEATSTSRLQHPNITTLYDFGVCGGAPYLVLELLRGRTIAQILERGPMPVDRALFLARQLCTALQHAHDNGVVHRDIKPANLIVLPGDRLKVMDFGLAVLAARPQGEDDSDFGTSPTGVGVAGTPLYMSPEQIRGAAQDSRVDMWALGVVLYEVLTGTLPFVTAYAALVREAPKIPRGDVPDRVVELVARCLRREPSERPSSIEEVLEVLDPFAPRAVPNASGSFAAIAADEDSFVGRDDELKLLKRLFNEENARLVVLLGPAGTGKTRLAREFGRRASHSLSGGVFVDLSDASGLDGIATSFAFALGVQLTTDDPFGQLIGVLESRGSTLVIVDNFEHLVDLAAESVNRLVQETTRVRLLVTSRQRLGLSRERDVRLEPLSLPRGTEKSEVEECPAIQLFVDRARRVSPTFEVTDSCRQEVVELVRRLDGLPLAIELAAARAAVLTRREMLDQMTERFALLRSTDAQADSRHGTLGNALEWSWGLLEDHEARALAECSVFEGGFALDAAEWIIAPPATGDLAIDVIESLLDKSLLRSWTPDVANTPHTQVRFGMLESVQAFARTKLREYEDHESLTTDGQSTLQALRLRHLRWYAQLFDSPPGAEGAVEKHRARLLEFDNLMLALEASRELADPDCTARLTDLAIPWLTARGPQRATFALIERALEREPSVVWKGRLLVAKAWRLSRAGQRSEALSTLDEAWKLVEELGSLETRSRVLGTLAKFDRVAGRMSESREKLEEAIRIGEEVGADAWVGRCIGNLALVHYRELEFSSARRLINRSKEIAERAGDVWEISRNIGNLAIVEEADGQAERARELYTLSLAMARRTGDRDTEAYGLGYLAGIHRTQGQFHRSRVYCLQAAEISRDVGDIRALGYWLGYASYNSTKLGEFEPAGRHIALAIEAAEKAQDRRQRALWEVERAALAWHEGRAEDADALVGSALEMISGINDQVLFASLLVRAAEAALDASMHERALALAQRGRARIDEISVGARSRVMVKLREVEGALAEWYASK